MSENEMGSPDGSEPSAATTDPTDWQAEYCRVHAELQGAYAELSALQRQVDLMARALQATAYIDRDKLMDSLTVDSKSDEERLMLNRRATSVAPSEASPQEEPA